MASHKSSKLNPSENVTQVNPAEPVPTQGTAVYTVETRVSSRASAETDNTVGMSNNIPERPPFLRCDSHTSTVYERLVNIHTRLSGH